MAFEIQRSFAAGELAPRSWLRSDLEPLHMQAVKQMRNVIADPHGPAFSRSGFEFITELEGETYCRLFDFDVSFAESYTVAITPNKIFVLDRNGIHLSDSYLSNGNFTSGGTGWISQETTFAGGLATLNPTGVNPAYVRQEVTVDSPDQIHILKVNGFGPEGDSPFDINVGTTEGGNDIFSDTAVGLTYETTFVPGVATFWIEVYLPIGGGTPTKVLDSIEFSGFIDDGDFVIFDSPYTEQDILEMQVDKKPGNKEMFLFTRGAPPHELVYTDVHVWAFEEIVFDFGSGSAPWGDEFPGCVAFHDGRMAVGGTYSLPVHIWMSKPREYKNFDIGSGGDPTDAMELPLDKHGELHWLRSNTQLFAGLDTGEHILFGNTGPISPDDAQTEQQSTYGSARIHAFIIDERVAYADTARRTVRVMDYSDEAKAYKSNNITFQSEHITEDRILEMRYAISPRGLIFCPTLEGTLVVASIENDQGTLGWHRHDTQGKILSISISKEFGTDVPYIAVLRDGKLLIERYDTFNVNFSDSYKVVESVDPDTVFFGYDHLIGQTVQVIADGKVHPDVEVQPDGSITLEYEANVVSAGLGFTALIETLPNQKDTNSGNTLSFAKRYSQVFAYLLDSPRPKINGFDPYLRFTPTPMGTREQNETGIVEISNDTGWDRESTITITQELALPMRISAVGGKLKENKV